MSKRSRSDHDVDCASTTGLTTLSHNGSKDRLVCQGAAQSKAQWFDLGSHPPQLKFSPRTREFMGRSMGTDNQLSESQGRDRDLAGRLSRSMVARTTATEVSISPRFPIVPAPGAGIEVASFSARSSSSSIVGAPLNAVSSSSRGTNCRFPAGGSLADPAIRPWIILSVHPFHRSRTESYCLQRATDDLRAASVERHQEERPATLPGR